MGSVYLADLDLKVWPGGTIEAVRDGAYQAVTTRRRKDGYVTFKHRGRTLYVHRVVCRAFRGPPPMLSAEAHHDDRDRSNNTEGNLSWLTPAENKALRAYPNRPKPHANEAPAHPELKRLWENRS